MPAPATVAEFLELVRKSGLVPEDKVEELLARHRATGTPPKVDQAANQLVRDGQLTNFQSKQLRLGRYKRFTIGSKYRLLELIGAGGMGAVYLCEHTLMRRLVALKVLPVEKLDDPSNLDRFMREARAIAALDHPNIVRAYDIDQYDKLHFLVMEYVDGTSLQEIVGRYALDKRPFDPLRAAHYVAQAAVGMQHAHELGMVHRDIKPGNLLLDRTGVIKVLDMGLARFFNKQQDSVTEKYDDKCVLGTADYLAPEQARTNMVDVRADIYSLGGTLYFMLTGQTPFPEGTIAAKLVAHQTREPRPVEAVRSDVPAGVLAVLRKMMAKEPTDRYQEPIEVAEALAEWADHPIPPPPEREMPALCPLVQALAAPSVGSALQPPLARVLFASRGSGARAGGSSANARGRPSGSRSTASNVAFPAPAKSAPRFPPDANVPVGGPVSTARAASSPTGALPPRPGHGSGLTKGKARPAPRPKPAAPAEIEPAAVAKGRSAPGPRRTWLFVAAGVALLALFVAGAVVAYQLGKGTKGAETLPGPVPGPADVILSPARAAEHEGEEQTVEFKVRSFADTTFLELNSEPEHGAPGGFAVRIDAGHFGAPADRERVQREFEGKTVRVRGKIQRDPQTGLYIDVNSPRQIVAVGR
jgi:serine/threonine protein kinase